MDEIRNALEGISRAWRERRFNDLTPFFDENIVMKGPAFRQLCRGREALADSYAEFMAKSKVVHYAESNHSIDLWGDTAAATYDWTMTYEQAGKTSTESGQDMFVFARRQSEWKAVLRVMLF